MSKKNGENRDAYMASMLTINVTHHADGNEYPVSVPDKSPRLRFVAIHRGVNGGDAPAGVVHLSETLWTIAHRATGLAIQTQLPKLPQARVYAEAMDALIGRFGDDANRVRFVRSPAGVALKAFVTWPVWRYSLHYGPVTDEFRALVKQATDHAITVGMDAVDEAAKKGKRKRKKA